MVDDAKVPPVKTDDTARSPITVPPSETPVTRKPRPWPFLLVLLSPAVIAAFTFWQWQQQEYMSALRAAWVALCSVLPGLVLMAVVGGMVQIRRRPWMSAFTILLGGGTIVACFWVIQKIVETRWLD